MTKIQELIASAIDEIVSCDESRSNEDKRTKAQCAIAKSLVALAMLKDRPEVVRCKDCERLIEGGCGGGDDMCAREGLPVSKNDYCSFAERRVKT